MKEEDLGYDHEQRLHDKCFIKPTKEPEAESKNVAEEESSTEVDGEGTDGLALVDQIELVEVANDWPDCYAWVE